VQRGPARQDEHLVDPGELLLVDRELVEVEATGVRCVATDTMMDDPRVAADLARTCLDLGTALRREPTP
jgi:hypothetical protein